MVMVVVSFITTLMVRMITMVTVSTMLMMMIKRYSIVMIRRIQFVGDPGGWKLDQNRSTKFDRVTSEIRTQTNAWPSA